MDPRELHSVVRTSGPDELMQIVNTLAAQRDWENLWSLRAESDALDRSDLALWTVTAHCDHVLALMAPATWVGRLFENRQSFSTLGPLTEIAAVNHSWRDLSEVLPPGPEAEIVAYERVVRGDLDVAVDERLDTSVLNLPFALAPWEPAYPRARYTSSAAHFPAPTAPKFGSATTLPGAGEAIGDPHVTEVFRELVAAWTTASTGHAHIITVEGNHLSAVAALGFRTPSVVEIGAAQAFALMAWAGASSGSQGHRRGMAYGRQGAWQCAAAIAGLAEEWPISSDEMGEVVNFLKWYAWQPDDGADEPATWQLRLAVFDPEEELGMAIDAVDTCR